MTTINIDERLFTLEQLSIELRYIAYDTEERGDRLWLLALADVIDRFAREVVTAS